MRYERTDPGHERVATLDIETTGFDPDDGEVVSVGVGVHDRGAPARAATYETCHRTGAGAAALIEGALDRLEACEADGLVSYNGREFDLAFLRGRLERLGESLEPPAVATDESRHVDLFADRKRRADRDGRKWPSLEECLRAYGYPRPVTELDGESITNGRFGEEVGPEYLETLGEDSPRAEALEAAIDHYLRTDLEANFALYYADIGETFEPELLGTTRAF
jgi:hypothetical protein